jgi:hypothetical protein
MDVVTRMRAPSFNILCFEGVGRGVALWYLTDDAAAESTFEGRNHGQRFPRHPESFTQAVFDQSVTHTVQSATVSW